MFFVFSCFLLRWKNVLSGSHVLHLRFIRNKSVTRTVISVNRPHNTTVTNVQLGS